MPNINDVPDYSYLNDMGYSYLVEHYLIPQKGDNMSKETEKKRYGFLYLNGEIVELTVHTLAEAKDIALSLLQERPEESPGELFELKSLGTFKAELVEVKNG
jgi:hypothetical protein